MAENTAIAWCRSTWNPWIGCTKVSPGCDHCYASVSTPARALKIEWGAGNPRRRTSEANWRQPLRWNKQAERTGGRWLVFCSSLADVFDNEVDPGWRQDLFDLIANTPHLTWLLLTKRIGNAEDMINAALLDDGPTWPWPNVWIGITVVNQAEADRDIPKLLAVPAARRFVSYEPALGPVDFEQACSHECRHEGGYMENDTGAWICSECESNTDIPGLDWIIVGGESDQPGMKARPFDIEWARSTVRQCKAAGVPVFFKQGGSHVIFDGKRMELRNRSGADLSEFPADIQVQEFPNA